MSSDIFTTFINAIAQNQMQGEKERDMTQSYDENTYTKRKFNNQLTTQKTPPKTSITQR